MWAGQTSWSDPGNLQGSGSYRALSSTCGSPKSITKYHSLIEHLLHARHRLSTSHILPLHWHTCKTHLIEIDCQSPSPPSHAGLTTPTLKSPTTSCYYCLPGVKVNYPCASLPEPPSLLLWHPPSSSPHTHLAAQRGTESEDQGASWLGAQGPGYTPLPSLKP